jgi:hypothetical protein
MVRAVQDDRAAENRLLRALAAVGALGVAVGGWPLAPTAMAGAVAAVLPWLGVRMALLGLAAAVTLAWDAPGMAASGLPRLSVLSGAALVAGGVLAARLAEPALRRPRNLLLSAALAVTAAAVAPLPALTRASLPSEILAACGDTPRSVVGALVASAGRATWAAVTLGLLVAFFPFAALAAWNGPDAGYRRMMPRFLWFGVLLAAAWPLLLATSGSRARAAVPFLMLGLWLESAVACLAVWLGERGPSGPPGVVFLPRKDA